MFFKPLVLLPFISLIFIRFFFFYILNILQISYCLYPLNRRNIFIYIRLTRRRRTRHRFCTLGFWTGTTGTTGTTGHCFKFNHYFQKLNYRDYSVAKAISSIDYFRRRIQTGPKDWWYKINDYRVTAAGIASACNSADRCLTYQPDLSKVNKSICWKCVQFEKVYIGKDTFSIKNVSLRDIFFYIYSNEIFYYYIL